MRVIRLRRRSLPYAAALLLGIVLIVVTTTAGTVSAVGTGSPAATATGTKTVEPVQGKISNVAVNGKVITGTLTLPADDGPLSVVQDSVVAIVGGQRVAVPTISAVPPGDQSTMLVIDTSGSMKASGMAAVRRAVRSFLQVVPEAVKVGVVSFADNAGVDLAPTTNHAAVQRVVDQLVASGDTALYDAMQQAVQAVGTTGSRGIVLLSDGGNTEPPKGSSGLASTTRVIAQAQVRVEVVGFRTDETNRAALQAIALAGNGSVVEATDEQKVNDAFVTAAQALETQTAFRVEARALQTGKTTVALQGSTTSGQQFFASQQVVIGGPSPTTTNTPSPTISTAVVVGPARASTPPFPWLLVLGGMAIIAGMGGVVGAVAAPAFRSRRRTRVSEIEQYAAATSTLAPVTTTARPSASAAAQQLIHLGDRVMAGRESTDRTMALLQRADLPWRAGEWWVLRMTSVVVGLAFGVVALGKLGVVGALIGAALGYVVPSVGLHWAARRRAAKFEGLLPDVLMVLATSLSSGFSLPQALDAVARDSAQPAAKEFSRALAETRIGADLSDALDRLAARMESENLRWCTMAIRIQREVGGNLAETMRTTARTLRERETLRRQVRALSAEGRLSAYILISLPIVFLVWNLWVNYDYVSLLWTRAIGLVMLLLGAVAMVFGIFWMRTVIRIKV